MHMLKLTALDAEDLAVISAHMQDAIARIGDMTFLRRQGTFALVANRFVWTGDERRKAAGQRRLAGLRINRVRRARTSHLRQGARDAVVSLLAITFEPEAETTGGTIVLTLSGGGAIRLEVEVIEVQMSDMGEEWQTGRVPQHDLDGAPAKR
jgi:Protein of unknown function (DUF2948)